MTWCEEAARQGECEAPSRDAGKVFRPPPLVSLDNSLLLSSEVDLGSMASELVDTVRRFCTSFAGGIEEINVSFHGELNKRLLASWLEWILRQQTHFPIPCNVQRINLSHTSLGDVGIRILADVLWPAKGTGIRHLTVLDVSDVLLTDVGFSAMCTKMSAYWGKLDTADAYASVLVDELCLSNNYLTSAVEESLIALLCDFRHHSFPLPLVHIIDVSNSLVFNKVSGLNLPMHTLANCLQPCDGLNFPRPDRTRVDMQLQCCAMSDLIVRNSLFFFFQDYGVKIQLYNDLLFSATCLTRDGEDGIGVKTSSPPRPTYNVRQFFVSQMRPRLPDSPITPLFTVGSHLTVIDFSYNINIGDKGVCDMLRLMLNFDYISFFYSQSIEVDEENDLGKYIELSNHYFVFMKEIRLRCVGMGPASLLLFNMLLRPFETFNDFEQRLQCDGDNNALAERISHMNKRIPTFVKDSSADRRGKYPLPFLSLLDISENHLVTDGNIGGMVDVIRNSVTRCQCTSDFLSPDAPFRLYVEKCGLQDHVVKEAARQLKSIQQRTTWQGGRRRGAR
ncbi:hypothetical protein AGDE_12855 [Angomonas deanei]|uniref:Leucine Rich repeat n=1 Tax=Angomonas deanei TaxID=59799 RepID=A0A7G2CL12_9TRYP|nr:hypothetical protein AGDE_12855 [Angomonas deanei]CAD2218922.1 hypothetical protein, conserved [Angomonas deanei]|eukprot:EPY23468.1 hypothetical protein AGDE_12855 [Angomonas deanei]